MNSYNNEYIFIYIKYYKKQLFSIKLLLCAFYSDIMVVILWGGIIWNKNVCVIR